MPDIFRTTTKKRDEEAEGATTPALPASAAKPDPNHYKFFGGGKSAMPGTGAETSLARLIREQAEAVERAKQEEAARALQKR